MQTVTLLAAELDKSVATLIVSRDHRTKRFIGEMLLAAAAAYLLKRYADKYLEGLGYFDEMAKKHGQATRAFAERLRQGAVDQPSLNDLERDLEEVLALGRTKPISETAKEQATAEVVEVLIEAGAVRAQARDEAWKVASRAEAELQVPPL